MRDTTETLLVAFLGLIGIELIQGWTAVIVGAVTVMFIIFRIIMGIKKDKREKERRAEEHARPGQRFREEEHARREEEHDRRAEEHAKHKLEIKLLQKELEEKERKKH